MGSLDAFYHTIAAISSPPGEGAVALIRISGKTARKILKKIFIPLNPGEKTLTPRVMTPGKIISPSTKKFVDQVMSVFFKSPHSYTGEDVVEITCHGGTYIQQQVLNACLGAGCLPAGRGEFTRRRFLNGKIDLLQAEAIGQLVRAKNKESYNIGKSLYLGEMKKTFEQWAGQLKDLLVIAESNLDFSAEDIDLIEDYNLSTLVDKLLKEMKSLHSTYNTAKMLENGINLSFCQDWFVFGKLLELSNT